MDIGLSTGSLKEFLALRDSRPEFRQVREDRGIGIPCFLRPDGSICFEPEELLESQ